MPIPIPQPAINPFVYGTARAILHYDPPTMWLKFLQKDKKTRMTYNHIADLIGVRKVDIPALYGVGP